MNNNKSSSLVAHQHIEGLVLSLEGLSKLPNLLGLGQVQDVDVDFL